ncbi:MAG: glucosaminidase domain-containing protein [Clostridium sp.]|nr:glucosaminidase domain-containing protein [Clostridium sp.]
MKKRIILSSITSLLVTSMVMTCNVKNSYALTEEQESFIAGIEEGALDGYETNHILPSLTIAQAILESGWGKSSLSSEANNLFGIKAFDDWNGDTINLSTKEYNSDCSSYTINSDFKAYSSFYESIKDHTALLSTKRYKAVRHASNYVEACYAVYNCGYATYPNYPEDLIEIIENFNLEKYDIIAKKNSENEYTLTKVESQKYEDSLSSVNGNNCADLFKNITNSGKDTKNSKNNIAVISVSK